MKKRPKIGAITIAFDDAYLDTYKHAIRYLNRKKIKSTISVPASLIGKTCENRPVMGVKELRSCVKHGHEIASHGLNHKNLLKLSLKDKDEAFFEISESKKELKRRLGCRITSFVFPYIKSNRSRELYLKSKKFYTSARITSRKPYFDRIPPRNPHDIVGFAVTEKDPVSYLNKLVKYARKNNLWLVEVFHLVGKKNTKSAHRPGSYRFFYHIDDFKRHIDFVLSTKIKILPQKSVLS